MADFNFYLNRQGVKGQKGDKGDRGFSPVITVEEDTALSYKLRIQNEEGSFTTVNLRATNRDDGGSYLKYDRENNIYYLGVLDNATEIGAGAIRIATLPDYQQESETTAVTPAGLIDYIETVVIPLIEEGGADITELRNELLEVEGEVVTLQGAVQDNTTAINNLSTSKQNTLVSGTNIKTINSNSILGSGNLEIEADIPIATTSVAGKVKPDGTTITITSDGTISGTSAYVLPTATTSRLGGVKVDGSSITVDADGTIRAIGGGGSYTEGDGIDITNNVISAKTDNVTVATNEDGELTVINGGQSIDPATRTTLGGVIIGNGLNVTANGTTSVSVDGQTIQIVDNVLHANFDEIAEDITDLQDRVEDLEDTVIPATTTNLGLVQPDGTTITIDSDGVISSAGGSGGGTWGSITGDLEDQEDLQEALDSKVNESLMYECAVIIDAGENYTVYSNGKYEEWGTVSGGTSVTVTLRKTMKDSAYNLQLTPDMSASNYYIGYAAKSPTGFTIKSSSSSSAPRDWYVCGYLAEGEY